MARSSEQVTQNEINSYKSFCDKQRIIHDGSQDDQHNADFIFNYFVNVWKQDITEQNLNTAWEHIRPHLKFKSAARAEFEKITSAAPDRARQLDQWLQAHGGKPGQLTNTPGDDTFENLTLLLGTLQGYEISTPRIQDAIDRIQNRPGRKLHYIEAPRKTQPTSRAALEDDGTPFVTQGLTLQRDGSLARVLPIMLVKHVNDLIGMLKLPISSEQGHLHNRRQSVRLKIKQKDCEEIPTASPNKSNESLSPLPVRPILIGRTLWRRVKIYRGALTKLRKPGDLFDESTYTNIEKLL